MSYKKLKSYEMSQAQLKQLWSDTYCNAPITTFDGIEVSFYTDMFEHAFYESDNRKEADKSIFSYNRCEKMLWIKEVLQDPEAQLKQGWNKNKKCYEKSRRVSLIKGNYIVVILIHKDKKARFITAYQIDDDDNLNEVKNSPDWA